MYATVWLTDRSGSLTTLSCNRTAVVVSCLTTFSLVNPDLGADRVAIGTRRLCFYFMAAVCCEIFVTENY